MSGSVLEPSVVPPSPLVGELRMVTGAVAVISFLEEERDGLERLVAHRKAVGLSVPEVLTGKLARVEAALLGLHVVLESAS